MVVFEAGRQCAGWMSACSVWHGEGVFFGKLTKARSINGLFRLFHAI